jgi:hypothetical protein
MLDNDIVDMREVNKLSKKKIALQKQYREELEKELVRYDEERARTEGEVSSKGYDKYIKYDEETDYYEFTDAYDKLFKDGVAIDPEQVKSIQEYQNQLNQISSD